MNVYEFRLSSGRLVWLDAVHVSRTYASLLEGSPDDEYNAKLIDRATTALSKTWGERQTHVIPPQTRRITEVGRTYDRFPELRYHAWLTSDPIEDRWCPSELVVCWFGSPEEYRATPLFDLVARAASDLPWERLARDFDY